MTTHSRFYSNIITKLMMSADDTKFINSNRLYKCVKIVNKIILDACREETENRTRFYRIYHEITDKAWEAYSAGQDDVSVYYLRLINIANVTIKRYLYKFKEDTNELQL